MKARIIDANWVPITTLCRWCLSATMPPRGATRKTGNWLAKPTDPSNRDDPVKRYTNQACATVCIQVPVSEISCPVKKSWKLRWRIARSVADRAIRFRAEPVGGLSLEGIWVTASFDSPYRHQ